METLGNYVITVCFAILLGSAARMLAPSEKYRGIMHMVSGIFILYALLSPLGKVLDFKIPSPDFSVADARDEAGRYAEAAQKAFDDALLRSASQSMQKAVEAAAVGMGIDGVSARVSINGENIGIWVSGVPPGKQNEMYDYIKGNFNTEPVITE